MKRERVLAAAVAEIGYAEMPPGSNCTKFGAWYGLNGQPWCMMFLQWVFHQAGAGELLPVKTASCTALLQAAEAKGQWVTKGYCPGDVVLYDFSGRRERPTHCGLVERAEMGQITAIEGNTGTANNANGGMVMRRTRNVSTVVGAWRPLYGEEETVVYRYLQDVPAAFRPVVETLMCAGIIQGDGSDPDGNRDVISLTHEQVRMLMFVYRGGGFDKKLLASGLKPAVEQ